MHRWLPVALSTPCVGSDLFVTLVALAVFDSAPTVVYQQVYQQLLITFNINNINKIGVI